MSEPDYLGHLTDYGFVWGPAEIERTCSRPKGGVQIAVKSSAGKRVDVYVSDKGKSVRVWLEGKELK